MYKRQEDDALWDTAKYIRRMKQRIKEHPHTCRLESVIYEHGTHFVFPESMLKTMLPVGSGLFVKLAFQAARKHPKECRRAPVSYTHLFFAFSHGFIVHP